MARGGDENAGRWHDEKVDLRALYRKHWGDPRGTSLLEVALFCDTDATGAQSVWRISPPCAPSARPRPGMPEQFRVELYWSFRSPYSYLALPRVKRLAAEYPVQWEVRIVYPLAIRTPGYFGQMNPLARPYFFRDTQRVAEYLGVPFRRPAPDPIVQDRDTLEIAALPFIDEVSRLPRKALIEANQAARRAAGHWGVPLFVFEGEPFFGQDRLDVLLWRMKQKGLRPRA